jgi:hypothetical protein
MVEINKSSRDDVGARLKRAIGRLGESFDRRHGLPDRNSEPAASVTDGGGRLAEPRDVGRLGSNVQKTRRYCQAWRIILIDRRYGGPMPHFQAYFVLLIFFYK